MLGAYPSKKTVVFFPGKLFIHVHVQCRVMAGDLPIKTLCIMHKHKA